MPKKQKPVATPSESEGESYDQELDDASSYDED